MVTQFLSTRSFSIYIFRTATFDHQRKKRRFRGEIENQSFHFKRATHSTRRPLDMARRLLSYSTLLLVSCCCYWKSCLENKLAFALTYARLLNRISFVCPYMLWKDQVASSHSVSTHNVQTKPRYKCPYTF